MINLLRGIRQNLLSENKLSTYLIYAIAEVLLVVFGILIAIQIDSWNEDRNLRKLEHILLMRLSNQKDWTSFKMIH